MRGLSEKGNSIECQHIPDNSKINRLVGELQLFNS